VPRNLGRLLAVLLIASPLASASIILERPEDVLNRPVYNFDPTPQFGPKFHFTRGPEIVVFPLFQAENGFVDMFSLTAIGIGFSLALLSTLPRWQRILILLKLLD